MTQRNSETTTVTLPDFVNPRRLDSGVWLTPSPFLSDDESNEIWVRYNWGRYFRMMKSTWLSLDLVGTEAFNDGE